ncbi:S-layer homology domain-containing protein, partial [Bacillus sp. L_1B0_8]|uniref:S-layer homology domain-containing protein n=1 Tax=Bacillus sp. L_1B0_8 TaxID=1588630 RepID=UPI000AAD61DF
MKRTILVTSLSTAILLANSSYSFADSNKFPDVPAWADKSVNYLVDKHVLNGYPDGTFGSNDSLDRASAATIMTKVLGIQIDSGAKPSFTDSQNHWATPYIAAAEKAGIVTGEGKGIFNPSGKVTRAAMATMLVNAYKLQSTPNDNGQSEFEDLKGHWGERVAKILINLKISVGTDNGWQPNRLITRAEAAQLVAKTDKYAKKLQIKFNPKQPFVVGTVLDATLGHVSVEYTTNDGKSEAVVVITDKAHTFAKGDKVQVSNRSEWKIQNQGNPISEHYLAPESSISKVGEKQKQDFVVGTVVAATLGHVSV